MNKKIIPTLWAFLIVLACLLNGCNTVLGLKHFVPPEGSNLGIEFDYPKKWEWVYRSDSSSTYVLEPDKPPYFYSKNPNSSTAGMIDIGVEVGVSPERQEERIKSWRDTTEAVGDEILEDKIIVIDGVSARWISLRIPESPNLNPDFEIYSIAVFVYENHNLYDLYLYIPSERRDGEFVRDFNRMISTIKFVP
jgi:hypothetical protein